MVSNVTTNSTKTNYEDGTNMIPGKKHLKSSKCCQLSFNCTFKNCGNYVTLTFMNKTLIFACKIKTNSKVFKHSK